MIPWYKPFFWGQEKNYVLDSLESTWISDGKYIKKFESSMESKLGADCVITTSNGTTALMLAYLSLGLGPGDEVIVPGFTFAAPANMVLAIGATPVFADVDPLTWLLCPKSVEEKITSKTKAIVPVHTYGNVCDMEKLVQIAKKYNLMIVEDVAEAAFSKLHGRQAGTFGDVGAFSFQATKTITMGEGGAICINRPDVKDLAQLIRNHGMRPSKRYWHEVVGHNFRLTNLQAALGLAQLEKVDDIILNKKRVYERYKKNLSNQAGIYLQVMTEGCDPVVWAIAVKIDANVLGISRDNFIEALKEKGIETRPGFYPLSELPIYNVAPLVNSTDIAHNVISLPSFTMISNEEIDHICSVFYKIAQSNQTA
ncbi:MAG: DegT/DnrJ/EryC1/StrS family aminotransferase [Bdellovibrio sp.]